MSDLQSSRREAEEQITKLEEKYETFLRDKANKDGDDTIESLQKELFDVRTKYETACQLLEESKVSHEKMRHWSFTVMKNGKENSSLKAEWASAQARAALAEAQLKSLKEEKGELVSYISRTRLDVKRKKQVLEDTIQSLSDGLLGVAKVVDEMADQQQKIVQEASNHEADIVRASEARDMIVNDRESRDAFFNKATKNSKKMASMLRKQGRKFAEHMDAYQAVLTRWSDSVSTTAAVIVDDDSSMPVSINRVAKSMQQTIMEIKTPIEVNTPNHPINRLMSAVIQLMTNISLPLEQFS